MYQEKPQMSKKKKIEILGIVLALVWILFITVDYFRYTNGKHPIFAIHTTKKYDDGTVDSYYGILYIYRSYKRTSITDEEFVPFWKTRKNPRAITDIPETYKGYTVPNNPSKEEKFRGLLYFYGRRSALLGTYKCINTDVECEKAVSGWDEYDISYSNPLTKPEKRYNILDPYDTFGWVDDSEKQPTEYGNPSYERIVYLLNYKENRIIARYADVKGLVLDTVYDKVAGVDETYIVKDFKTKKWGVIKIYDDGNIDQLLPFEYDSVNYDEDSEYYIVKKDSMWYVYDLKKEINISDGYADVIYDVWTNSNKTTYIATGKKHTIGDYEYIDYKIYTLDGKAFMTDPDIVAIYPHKTWMFYISRADNKLKFITYNKSVKKERQLNFAEILHTNKHKPCVEILKLTDKYIEYRIYESSDPNAKYEDLSEYYKEW